MTARLAAGGGGLALLVLLSLWISMEGGRTGGTPAAPGAAAGGGGFEIVMREVDVREIRSGADGASSLTARSATFLPAEKVLLARGLAMSVPGRTGPVVVEAPEGDWRMDEGRLLLSGGAVARAPGPWEGATAAAVVDIRGRVMSASGPAEIRGPGIFVTGRNLTWRWQEGTVGLDAPKSRIAPARVRAGRKEG